MKILIVAVFCAFFAVASSQGEISMKLTTVQIMNQKRTTRCFGVLIANDRVAMPEECWDEDLDRWARVGCWDEKQQEILYDDFKIEKLTPENERLYIAEQIVEVWLKKKVDEACWRPGKRRLAVGAINVRLREDVTVVGLNQETTKIITKPYRIYAFDEKRIRIGERKEGPKPVHVFTSGEPLFSANGIAGMFIKDYIYPGTQNAKTFIKLRKHSTAGTSRRSS